MAGIAPRVDYLAGFSCPVGGLAAGKARVLCLGAEIFLSTGRKRVYVYNLEGRQLTAAYRFPGQVCHLEVLAPRRELLVLCAQRGVYCLSLDQENRARLSNQLSRRQHVNIARDTSLCSPRSRSRSDGDDGDGEPPCPVVAVGPDACVLPDPTLYAFTVLDNALITLAQGAPHWKVQLFECPCPGQDPRPPGQIGEVELSTYPTSAGSPGTPEAPRVPPVLCCVRPPGSRVPHSIRRGPGGFTLEGALFGVLFGADATLLGSPVVLCGLPSGQLCWVALRTLVTSRSAPGDPKALVRILHHLEEPVIFIGALRTEPPSEDVEDACCDCLVALGHRGRALAVKARWDEAGVLVPELREHRLLGPVLCAACGGGGRLYHSTPSSLCEVVLARGSAPGLSEGADVRPESPGGLPAALCPAGLSVCGVVALAVSPWSPGGGPELLALSARGRLLACRLAQSSETLWAAGGTVADPHRKVKDLLLSISSVSERASSLKKAIDQRNKALTCLNEAMNVSCALLSSREGPRPISCTTATAWSRRELQDVLTATCLLENSSGSPLGRGWVLCIQVLPGSLASDPDAAGSAATYTVPVGQLGPGGRREVTLTLGPSEDGVLDLPMTVSCALFCSLAEALGGALDPWGSFRDAPAGGRPPSTPAEPGGICLPLGEHTVDMLQCLRFPGLAAPPAQAPGPRGPASGPVDTFLEAGGGPGSQRAGPEPLRAVLLPPPVAAVKVSVELLRAACGGSRSGASLCCATLQWLLAENAAEGVVRAQALSSVQGVAPDGADVRLTVHEVTVTDVCPAGPLRAVEIQVESTSLASMCMAHSAVLGRLQRVVVEQAARGHSLPDLRLQYLHQIRANHEALLREVQTLRDRLCTEDTASSCTATEQLLQLYRQLRSPSLLLL